MQTIVQKDFSINDIIAASNKTINTMCPTVKNTKSILTFEEKEILYYQILNFAKDYVSNFNYLSIYMNYEWLKDINFENSVNYFFNVLSESIEMSVRCMNNALHIDNICKSYNKTILMNAITIYGSSVYFLDKLVDLPLVIKSQNDEKIKLIYEKIKIDHKVKFYIAFETLINEVISYYENEENYNINVQQLSNDKLTLLSYLIDCCENVESLNFNCFLN
jgi:hypothetical protein